MSRFAALPEGHQQQILQNMDSEATSVPTPDPGYLDDMYPAFENSLSDNSGGDPSSSRPSSGGDRLTSRPISGGEH